MAIGESVYARLIAVYKESEGRLCENEGSKTGKGNPSKACWWTGLLLVTQDLLIQNLRRQPLAPYVRLIGMNGNTLTCRAR